MLRDPDYRKAVRHRQAAVADRSSASGRRCLGRPLARWKNLEFRGRIESGRLTFAPTGHAAVASRHRLGQGTAGSQAREPHG